MTLIICRIPPILIFSIFLTSFPFHIRASSTIDTTPPDTVASKIYSFNPKQLILPGALIAVGTLGVYSNAFKNINHSIRHGMEKFRGGSYFHADDYIQYIPAAAYLGLDFVGVKAQHSFRERLAVGITAYASMAIITNAVKYAIREPRPDNQAHNSFPSGHTATAFTGAELVREDYGLWPGICAYTVATGTAFLRLYNNRHWFNDILAGAGVGILSARIGYWMLPLYRRWFKWDYNNTAPVLAIMPAYNNNERSLSFNLICVF